MGRDFYFSHKWDKKCAYTDRYPLLYLCCVLGKSCRDVQKKFTYRMKNCFYICYERKIFTTVHIVNVTAYLVHSFVPRWSLLSGHMRTLERQQQRASFPPWLIIWLGRCVHILLLWFSLSSLSLFAVSFPNATT